jgi:hypothetical protein
VSRSTRAQINKKATMKLFLSRGMYVNRPARHFDMYQRERGYWFIEVGRWTLEVELPFLVKRAQEGALQG